MCTVDVNRVLETRFTGGPLLTQVPPRTRSNHENRPSKSRLIGQNRVSYTRDAIKPISLITKPTN